MAGAFSSMITRRAIHRGLGSVEESVAASGRFRRTRRARFPSAPRRVRRQVPGHRHSDDARRDPQAPATTTNHHGSAARGHAPPTPSTGMSSPPRTNTPIGELPQCPAVPPHRLGLVRIGRAGLSARRGGRRPRTTGRSRSPDPAATTRPGSRRSPGTEGDRNEWTGDWRAGTGGARPGDVRPGGPGSGCGRADELVGGHPALRRMRAVRRGSGGGGGAGAARSRRLDVCGCRCTAEQPQPAEKPIEDQVEEA